MTWRDCISLLCLLIGSFGLCLWIGMGLPMYLSMPDEFMMDRWLSGCQALGCMIGVGMLGVLA